MKNSNKLKALAGGVASLAVAGAASAQGTSIDVSSVTAVVTEVATAAGTIGLAVLAMHYGIKAYKWIKGAG